MARKYSQDKPFPYKIHVFDKETYEGELRRRKESRVRMVVETIAWKQGALRRIKLRFAHQISKMRQQIKRPWYCYYTVHGYGASSGGEFICPQTSMRARRIKQDYAFFFRQYYAKCVKTSLAILGWLSDLEPYEYTVELHHYLLRLVVVQYPSKHWIERHEQHCPEEFSCSLGA
jgi:hypothetical protein